MNKQSWSILVVALVLLGSTGLFLSRLHGFQKLGKPGVKVVAEPVYGEKGKVVGTNSIYLPDRVLNYDSQSQPVSDVVLNWLPKDTTYGQRLYKAPDGFAAVMNAVLMGSDRTSIHKPEYCLAGMGWRIAQKQISSVPIAEPHSYDLPVMRFLTTREDPTPEGKIVKTHGVYVFWFVADNQLSADHTQRMWWMARDMIRTGTLQRWAYIACFAPCAPGQEEMTFQRLKELIASSVPHFQLATGAPSRLAGNL